MAAVATAGVVRRIRHDDEDLMRAIDTGTVGKRLKFYTSFPR
jgi:hypothetical protein